MECELCGATAEVRWLTNNEMLIHRHTLDSETGKYTEGSFWIEQVS